MQIGLTYDLKQRYLEDGYAPWEVAELDAPETIDAIATALQRNGFEPVKIGNVKDLVQALATGRRWPLVFNIAEGLHGLCREAQIPALLDAYRIPYVFSDSMTLAITLHKALAKSVVRQHGVPTADYCLIEHVEEIDRIDLPFPLFIKPVGGGTGMGIDGNSIVSDTYQLYAQVRRLLSSHNQSVLVETYLSGREFTVGVVGTAESARVIGMMEIVVDGSSDHGVYSYTSKQQYLSCTRYQPVSTEIAGLCKEAALGAWRALGCRDGGRIDLRMDEAGIVNFIEVNPLAGLHPIDSDLPILATMAGVSYDELIGMIMASACERIGVQREPNLALA